MNINLERFSVKKEVIVPIVDGWGKYEGRKIYAANKENGYYKTTLENSITVHGRANPFEVRRNFERSGKKRYRVYAIGEEGVATNFDVFSRKGFGETIKINFMAVPLFEIVEVIQWEDKRFYFYETKATSNRRTLQEVRECFRNEKDLSGLREITPEIRYYFLLATLQREGIRAAEEIKRFNLSKLERERRIKDLESLFPNRLKSTIAKAGGSLVGYNKHGKGYLVEWKIGDQTVKSIINDEMRILNAGYCLSGDDKKHTMSSIVNLAKLFQMDSPLYITRE